MSTKSKPTMESTEGETKSNGRPTRNLKPVSYKEIVISKRNPPSDKAVKESSEPKDKKKKNVNGSSNVDEPTKKSGKKKAADPIDDPIEQNVSDDDELMPESRAQPDVPKPVAEKATANSKKGQTRKKKAEEDGNVEEALVADSADKKSSEPKAEKSSKIVVRKKGKDAVEETTNGEGSSKPIESEAVSFKPARGRKGTPVSTDAKSEDEAPMESVASKPVTSKSSKGKKAPKESNEMEATSENQDKPVSSKPVASKTVRGRRAEKDESNDGKVKGERQDEVPAKSKPVPEKATKAKKAVKESNDAVDDIEDTEASTKVAKGSKGAKKAVAKDQPTIRGTKRKAVEATQNTVSKPKIAKTVSAKPTTNLQTAKAKTASAKATSTLQTTSIDLQSPKAEWNVKISTWNVAGLRAAVKKNGVEFLKAENSDIICLQETKCTEDQIPPEIDDITGYHKYWRGEKGGKAGVALFSKVMPYDVKFGFDDREMDAEARVITAEFTKFYLVCVYVPNAGRKLVNLQKRLVWDTKFQDYLEALNEKKPVIICGDMNVAHQEIDLANPKTNKKSAGFTQEERDSFSRMLSKGFVDTFRALYPDQTKAYTFWTYLANARAKNVGWRLDYFLVSERLLKNIIDNVIRSTVLGSDHCPVTLFLKF